jgi:hypothetical protein
MRFLYATSDRSFWERARLMLHGEGIETYESDVDPALSGLGSPLMQREYRLYILNDDDALRANEILIELGAYRGPPARNKPLRSSWKLRLFLLAVGVLVIVVAFL